MSQITPWNKQRIQQLIAENDRAVVRALLAVYANQTPAEQANGSTVEDNGAGFTGADAEILTSFVKFYQRAGFLTPKQVALARARVGKYWRQLLIAAENNGHAVAYN